MQHNVQPCPEPQRAACGARRPGWDQGPAIGRHRIPCVLPEHGRDVDHRNALGKTWPVSPDADLMRVDAPQVSEAEALAAYRQVFEQQQTHVIRLLDSPGATLTVTCPDWCESGHVEDETHGTYLEDFAHRGAEEALHVDLGDGTAEDVLLVEITQYPFGRDLRQPTVILWPTLGMTEAHMDPDRLCALGEQLHEYANALTGASIRLAEIRRGNR